MEKKSERERETGKSVTASKKEGSEQAPIFTLKSQDARKYNVSWHKYGKTFLVLV